MFEYVPVDQEIQDRHKCVFFSNYVRVFYRDPTPVIGNNNPTFIAARYKDFADTVKEFPIMETDVWIASYPKTGTTLTCELVRVLRHGMNDEEDIYTRVPFLECNTITDAVPVDLLSVATSLPEPRTIKTHLAVNLLPKDLLTSQAKIIYVIRNPKDTAISYYHHHVNVHCWKNPNLKVFLEDFLTGDIMFGSYFSHAEEYLQLEKLRENILVIKYEDMVTDMKGVVSEVSKFLNMSLTDKKQTEIADYMHFDQMKLRQNSNMEPAIAHTKQFRDPDFKFLRRGKVGSFKEEMPTEFIQMFDEETKKWKFLSELYPN